MLFTKLTVATFLAGAIASPVAVDESVKLAKRAEGIHLVNCGQNNVDRYSVVVYCANDSNCNFNPGPGNSCVTGNGGLNHWEGSSQSCTFPGTGTTFSWNIQANAQSQPNFVQVGNGNNGFHNFNIFKDDKHVMYTDGNGNQCRSIYYCLNA